MTMEKGLIAQEQGRTLEAKQTAFRQSLARVEEAEKQKAETLMALGFDPSLHLALYQNRVIVNKYGAWWWGTSDPRFRRISSEPVSAADKEAYGIGPEEIGVIAKLYVQGDAEPFCTGFGRASRNPKTPVVRGSAVEAAHPYLLAEKRAELQALNKFRPTGVRVAVVDTETGEIIEGTVRDVPTVGDTRKAETTEPTMGVGTPPGWPVGEEDVAQPPQPPKVPLTEAEWRKMPATDPQRRALFTTAKGWTQEEIRGRVAALVGSADTSLLTRGQAHDLLAELQAGKK